MRVADEWLAIAKSILPTGALLLGLLASAVNACGSSRAASDHAPPDASSAGSEAGVGGNVGDDAGDGGVANAADGGAAGEAPVPVAPSAAVTNLRDHGVTHTGFVLGTAAVGSQPLGSVEVAFDDAPYSAANGTATWSFPLPSGDATWREGSLHTIRVRATDAAGVASTATTLSVRKGVNRDVNGDGYEDLALRNSYVSLTRGEADIFLSAGAAGVPSADVADAATVLSASYPSFGWGIALGDINGDGYADIVVGAQEANDFAGSAFVFYSAGEQGIPSAKDTAADAVLTGLEQGREFGQSAAVADINGDGYGDVVIGAGSKGGGIYVFHSAGSSGVASATVADANLKSEEDLGNLGYALAAGDINGDGYADVVAGNPNAYSGAVRIFYSAGAAGIPDDATAKIVGGGPGGFGVAIAVADVNGDGFGDIAVSTSVRVYLFYGAPGAGIVAADDSAADATFAVSNTNLSAGDANGDGYADIVVGDNTAASNTGEVRLFYSAGSLGIPSSDVPSADVTLVGTTPVGRFGFCAALNDLNGDGYADLVVGSQLPDRVYLFPSAGEPGVGAARDIDATSTLTAAHGDFGSLIAR